MKKRLLFLCMLAVSASTTSFGQTTGTANLNITLSSVLSMTVASPDVNVNFDSETKYTNGITSSVPNHIVVVSSRGYTVSAGTGTIAGTSALAAGTVKITTAIGTANEGNAAGISYVTGSTLPVAASASAVITATNSSWSADKSTNKFDVTYLIGANGAYANKAIASDNVIPVVYTITQQ